MATRVQAILARDVPNLGHVGEVIRVTPGYLRNFLLPKKMALPVSKKRLRLFEHQSQLIKQQIAKLKANSEDVRDRIEVHTVTIEVKAGDQGKIFGSVGARDIENALKESGFIVHHRDIKLDGPLKTIGIHEVTARLEGGVMAKLKIVLVAKEEPVEETNPEEEFDAHAEYDEDENSDDVVSGVSNEDIIADKSEVSKEDSSEDK
jgi:large subunit ribosomal protein L9